MTSKPRPVSQIIRSRKIARASLPPFCVIPYRVLIEELVVVVFFVHSLAASSTLSPPRRFTP
jgi:hypothetical protein